MIPHAYILPEPCSNNVAEYRAIIMGMQVAQAVGAKSLEVYGDSQLVVNQMKDTFEVRKPNLIPHHAAAKKLVDGFTHFYIQLVFRMKNAKADALAGLAASLSIPEGESLTVTVCEKLLMPSLNTYKAFGEYNNVQATLAFTTETWVDDWRTPIIDLVNMTSCLKISERQPVFKGGPKVCLTMRPKPRCYTGSLMTASCYGVFPNKKRKKC